MTDAAAGRPLAPDLPFFRGHFPGRPILPGVAHLALVADALGATIVGVPRLRFTRPAGPGTTLHLATERTGPRVRFEILGDGEPCSAGTLVVSEGAAASCAPSRGPAPRSCSDVAAADPATLLPHVPPARLITGLLTTPDEALAAEAAVPGDSPFAHAGTAPAFLAIEAAAQAAAAFEALRRRSAGGDAAPRVGFLVGVREATFTTGRVPLDTAFEVRIRLEGVALPLSRYAFETPFAAGSISTYV